MTEHQFCDILIVMKQIFEYLDYQLYLKEFYDEKKNINTFFSYRYMGMKVGIDAGYLVKILQGKVNLSNKAIPRMTEFLKLNEKESEYFDILVRFAKAKTEKDSQLYFEKLLKLRGVDLNLVVGKQYEFYKKWYYNAIRSMLAYYPFNGNYSELSKLLCPQISVKEAKEAISLLLSLNLIKKDSAGIYRQTDVRITTGNEWRSAAIHSFQKETISLAEESLDRVKKELRDISSITISANQEDLEQLREMAREFRNSIHQMKTGRSKSDTVFQINLQIIPLTEAYITDED